MGFTIGIVAFLVCMIIQYKALHKGAFGRGIFIQIAMFFFVGLVYIAPNAPRWLVWALLVLTWGFTIVLTMYSLNRGKSRK
jgi:Ca2+/Na+ antiporter